MMESIKYFERVSEKCKFPQTIAAAGDIAGLHVCKISETVGIKEDVNTITGSDPFRFDLVRLYPQHLHCNVPATL